MRFSRGEVVLVLFPDSNMRTAKRRPAIVVQSENLNTGLEQIVLAMITSNLGRAGHPSRILVTQNSSEGQQMGLLTDSVIMTDNLATVRENELNRVIGRMVNQQPLDAALRHTLGLN